MPSSEKIFPQLEKILKTMKVEEQIENADVDISNYGVIVSPGTRKILRTTLSFPSKSITT